MAVIRKWGGDGLSAGTLTTSSAGTGDNAFTFVTGATIVESGTRSPQIALADSSAANQVRWNALGGLTTWGVRMYFSWASGTPSSSIGLIHGYDLSAAAVFRVEMNTSGLLRIRNASSATWSQTSGGLVAGQRYRIEIFGGSGSATLRIYEDESQTPIVNQTSSVENLSIGEIRFGRHSSATQTGFTMDDLAIADTASEIGAVAPVVISIPLKYGDKDITSIRYGSKTVTALALGNSVIYGTATPGDGIPEGFQEFYTTNFATNDGFEARTETQANDNSYNTPANVSYTPDGLVILGKRESLGGRPFTTGDVLGTHISIPNYFHIEVDATLPIDYGMWPCPCWLRPNNSNNGGHGELDLCETWTFDWNWNSEKTSFTSPVSYSTMWENYTTSAKQNAPLSYLALPNPDPGARHTYTCIKTAGRLEYLIDGIRVYCWQTGATYNATNKIGPPPSWFNSVYEVSGQTWYPRFTLQLGGSQTPDPLPSWTQSQMTVHEMRIYTPV